MRILLSHVYAWPEVRRGGERYLHELAAALHDAGHEVEVLTTAAVPQHREILGVPVTYLQRRRVLGRRFGALADEVAFGGQALRWAASRGFDVWHALGTADAAAAVALAKVRPLRTAYTNLGFPARASRDRRPDRRLHDLVVRGIDRYICLSEATGAYLRDDYGREPDVLGGGVDLARFGIGQRSAHPSLLFTGAADEPRKNLPLLVGAFAALACEIPDLELWLAGPGSPDEALEGVAPEVRARITQLPLGDPSALGRTYGAAWATVLPSTAEAFGLVLVESLACGTPVVALDRGGPAEIVTPAVGATAAPDIDALAAACRIALALAESPGIAEVCRAAATEHDWREGVVPRLLPLYRHPLYRDAGDR